VDAEGVEEGGDLAGAQVSGDADEDTGAGDEAPRPDPRTTPDDEPGLEGRPDSQPHGGGTLPESDALPEDDPHSEQPPETVPLLRHRRLPSGNDPRGHGTGRDRHRAGFGRMEPPPGRRDPGYRRADAVPQGQEVRVGGRDGTGDLTSGRGTGQSDVSTALYWVEGGVAARLILGLD